MLNGLRLLWRMLILISCFKSDCVIVVTIIKTATLHCMFAWCIELVSLFNLHKIVVIVPLH